MSHAQCNAIYAIYLCSNEASHQTIACILLALDQESEESANSYAAACDKVLIEPG